MRQRVHHNYISFLVFPHFFHFPIVCVSVSSCKRPSSAVNALIQLNAAGNLLVTFCFSWRHLFWNAPSSHSAWTDFSLGLYIHTYIYGSYWFRFSGEPKHTTQGLQASLQVTASPRHTKKMGNRGEDGWPQGLLHETLRDESQDNTGGTRAQSQCRGALGLDPAGHDVGLNVGFATYSGILLGERPFCSERQLRHL